MGRATVIIGLVGALSGLLVACEQLTGVSDLSVGERAPGITRMSGDDGGEQSETDSGGAVDSSGSQDSGQEPFDAGADTTPPACTALPTNDTFPAALGAEWMILGNAAAAMPGVRLTPSAGGMTGALWWAAQSIFDRFEVTFGYVITQDPLSTGSGPGDGIAFGWVASNAPPALGGTGGGLAMQGLTGFAIAIDTYTNTEFGDQPTPNIALKNTLDMTNIASSGVIANLHDGNVHAVKVRLADGSVTVTVDGNIALGPTVLQGYVPFAGYWGFGAGTGGAFEDHLLKSATMRIGTTGACAAP